jgi:hypothetical protein
LRIIDFNFDHNVAFIYKQGYIQTTHRLLQ